MKKLFYICLMLSLICSTQSVKASNEQTIMDTSNSFLITNEPAMPILQNNAYQVNSISTLNQREQWIETVTTIQEEAYNQKVKNVSENNNYIIFEFETNDNITSSNNIFESDEEITFTEIQILNVYYLKPESSINQNLQNYNSGITTNSVVPSDPGGGSTTKIIEYYGWSDGYVTYGKKSGILKSIMSLAIGYVPTKSVLVSWALGEAMGAAYDSLANNASVTSEIKNKYYYRNKAGCVYMANQWVPIAFVGQRRSFAWEWATAPNSYGEPILYKNESHNSTNSKDGSGYDAIEYKAHYNDNTWIINKALETKNNGGYYDCFAVLTNLYN
ncbi:MAG: hypothetical protein ACI4U3_06150 [Traorella sp.]